MKCNGYEKKGEVEEERRQEWHWKCSARYSLEKRSISEGIESSGIAPYRNSLEMKRHAVVLPRIAME